jgi:hypothetical protein
MMGSVISRINQTDGMGDPSDLTGLSAVAQSIEEHIGILAMSDEKKQLVKEFSDVLGDMMNKVRAFAQRQQEAMESEQLDPEKMARIQESQALTQQKLQANDATVAQKLQHKDVSFRQKLQQQQQKMIQSQVEAGLKVQIEQMKAANEAQISRMQAQLNMALEAAQAASKTVNERIATLAKAENAQTAPKGKTGT